MYQKTYQAIQKKAKRQAQIMKVKKSIIFIIISVLLIYLTIN